MKNNIFSPVIILFISLALATCTKNEDFIAAGGNIPTNYITIQPGGNIGPATLRINSGSSITFVNNDNKPHHIISTDSISFNTLSIASKASYFLKKDNLTGTFPYRCILDSTVRGTIIISP